MLQLCSALRVPMTAGRPLGCHISKAGRVACLISYIHLAPKRGGQVAKTNRLLPSLCSQTRSRRSLSDPPRAYQASSIMRLRVSGTNHATERASYNEVVHQRIQVCYSAHACALTHTSLSSYGFSAWTSRRVTLMQSSSLSGLFSSLFLSFELLT